MYNLNCIFPTRLKNPTFSRLNWILKSLNRSQLRPLPSFDSSCHRRFGSHFRSLLKAPLSTKIPISGPTISLVETPGQIMDLSPRETPRQIHFEGTGGGGNVTLKLTMSTFPTSPSHHCDIYALIGDFQRSHGQNFARRNLHTISDSPDEVQSPSSPGGGPSGGPGVSIEELLERAIKFKDKNASHITIEKAAKELCTAYSLLTTELEKLEFFKVIASRYTVDQQNISNIAQNLIIEKNPDSQLMINDRLRVALIPKYYWLFTQIGRLENGVKFLVCLRTDLLDILESHKELSTPQLRALSNSLRDLISMWFSVGFLNLERVTWKSSCEMLQKIADYEAVHKMSNWNDLKRRVGNYRRCFVYTHASMPGEPVVVLHTALTDHIISNIRSIIANPRMKSFDSNTDTSTLAEDPDFINTAIFYSVTSTQKGLSGIELGNYLIKRVVKELQNEFPKMNQFSTLSPIPGFRSWLLSEFKCSQKVVKPPLFTPQEEKGLCDIFEISVENKDEFYEKLLKVFKMNEWHQSPELVKELEVPLIRLCCRYLVLEKRRAYALDGVAHFHLKNGAVIWRLNWLGDNTASGLTKSCGIMVNYRYFIDECEINSQNYLERNEIKLSDQVRLLSKLAQGDIQQSKI